MRSKRVHRTTEFDEQLLKTLIIEYKENNVSLRKLQEKYNINRHKLAKIFEEMKVKTTKGNHYRTYFHNFDYFEKIDSHEKAYWLGFIMADGYIQQYKNKYYGEDCLGITLHENDSDMLDKFKNAISATNPVKFYTEKTQSSWVKKGYNPESKICKIILKSQKTCDDLIKKGVTYNKSLEKNLPNPDELPREYFYSYLRGYYDGNGTVYIHKRKTIENSFSFAFSTCISFAKDLQNIIGGTIIEDKRCDYRVCTLKLTIKESEDLFEKMYKDSTTDTRMERKYLKILNKDKI